jgi:hypothetical protein
MENIDQNINFILNAKKEIEISYKEEKEMTRELERQLAELQKAVKEPGGLPAEI